MFTSELDMMTQELDTRIVEAGAACELAAQISRELVAGRLWRF